MSVSTSELRYEQRFNLFAAVGAGGWCSPSGSEAQVLRAARDGGSVSGIAHTVFLSEGTVRNHLSAAIGKTEARNRGDAVRIAEENGWL